MRRSAKRRSRGAALVVVLSVTVFLALLAVSLAVALKLDRQASHYYAERSRADFFTREAIEAATAALHEGTAANRNWVSGPGRIISSAGKLSDSTATNVPLYSGSAAAGDTNAADINRRVLSDDEKELVTGRSGEPMRIAWVYVRKDGTRTPSATVDPQNPVVGRYAYWTDDESSRIDINTAWTKTGNTNSINHPSQVDLTAISAISVEEANAIRDKALIAPFHSPHDARRIDPALAGVLSSNRFDLTHNAHSTALNPWGEPKIILTTQRNKLPKEIAALPANEARNYFLDILRTDNSDPGTHASLSVDKVTYQIKRLADLFSRTNWPYADQSFVGKYGYFNAVQLALDTIEYVRSAESSRAALNPLRMNVTGSGAGAVFSFNAGVTDPNQTTLIGSPRRPFISELGAWYDGSGPLAHHYLLKAEFMIPKSSGITPEDLNNVPFNFGARFLRTPPDDYATVGQSSGTISSANTAFTDAGEYLIGVITIRGGSSFKTPIDKLWFRMTLGTGISGEGGSGFSTSFWELAPAASVDAPLTAQYNIECPVNPSGSAGATAQVSDPRINKYKANWEQLSSTLGTFNRNWLKGLAVTPPQDTDANGEVTDAGFILPERRGSPSNPIGLVRSVSELGRIPTGVGANIPWRTVRLQPTPNSSGLPDWALLDLFMAPYFPTNHSTLYTPKDDTVAGRINLNSKLTPFTNLGRSAPLRALFTGNTNMTKAEIEEVASNVLERIPAPNGGRLLGATNSYVSAGELTQIKGISDQGEASEQRLFGVADLAAVQSNVFRIYAIGQAVQQTRDGRLVVQAEKAVEAMLERSQTPGQPPSFHVVFWKVIPL